VGSAWTAAALVHDVPATINEIGKNEYQRRYRRLSAGLPVTGTPSPPRTCSVADCDRAVELRGLCATHLARRRKHGDPLVGGALA
jgi:hypothetical protein